MLTDFGTRHALLLQGPVGPFFRRFADELIADGAIVTKVNFNPGDALFFRGPEVVSYREPMEVWPEFFRNLVTERSIDGLFLFGDCRRLHRQAVGIARELGIPVWVFEEGYLRPDHFTVERGGVNGHSHLPKDPEVYRRAARELPPLSAPTSVGNTFPSWALWTTMHSVACTFARWRYPLYRHHRDVNSLTQAACWVRGGARKLWYARREEGILEELSGEYDDHYFFVPLQVHCDSQIDHSDYACLEEMIEEVVSTFARHAPAGTLLVLKHHPHDRAYRDYTSFLRALGEHYRCSDRLRYVHDLHLPTLLKHARGTITMNSTVGTSSLYHGTPVKVMGRAIYDVPELTFQGSLVDFLADPGEVDTELFDGFCRYLRHVNQVNGSFYRQVSGLPNWSRIHPTVEPTRRRGRLVRPPAASGRVWTPAPGHGGARA